MSGSLQIHWNDWLSEAPPGIPADIELANKVEGMLLGLAIGDALGNTSESMMPEARNTAYGRIDGYLPNRYAEGRRVGLPSDDTQMAFWTIEHLVSEGRLEPQYLGASFSHRRIYGLGKSVREFLSKFKQGVPWHSSGAQSAGNGALMRIAPVLLPYLQKPNCDLWSDTLMAAHLTHNDELSNICCVAFVDLLWRLISRDSVPESGWWLETIISSCEKLESQAKYQPRGEHPHGFSGGISKMIKDHVVPALDANLSVTDACSIWHSGAYLLETFPSVIYILARHGHDPEAAIKAAVNETRDNDTIGAIVGAAVGALHGGASLPEQWISGLLGRTDSSDVGRVFQLIAAARRRFGYGVSDLVHNRVPEAATSTQHRRPQSGPVTIRSESFWVKVVEMLQQNWAAIDDLPDGKGVRIWFFDDGGGVFDTMDFCSRNDACKALEVNGFAVFTKKEFGFLAKPGPAFIFRGHPNGAIYSSGRYWVGSTGTLVSRQTDKAVHVYNS